MTGRFSKLKQALSEGLGRLTLLVGRLLRSTRPAMHIIAGLPRYRHTDQGLLVSATIIGVVVGLFVVLFHAAMELAEHVFEVVFLATDSYLQFGAVVFALIPALGGLSVGLLNRTAFKGVEGEGLPSVIHALGEKHGRMDWRESAKSILNAALSIGSGGGAGREGPTITLGASLGSSVGQILQLRPRQLRVLCASGAAAAVSAIFNAPLGGIVFALEAIIAEVNIRSFIPLVISSVLATATARLFVGNEPLLSAPSFASVGPQDYLFLALAGVASGAVAIYYVRAFRWAEGRTHRMLARFPSVWRPALGGLAVGLMVVALPTLLETTYNPINKVISGQGVLLWVAAATVIAKPISNAITVGSGGAGGTFAPAMKAGAMFGYGLGLGLGLQYFFPNTSPGLYAVVCAGAVLAGSWQLPLTGGIVLFEISRNYELLLPLMFSAVFASFIVQRSGVETFNPMQRKTSGDLPKVDKTPLVLVPLANPDNAASMLAVARGMTAQQDGKVMLLRVTNPGSGAAEEIPSSLLALGEAMAASPGKTGGPEALLTMASAPWEEIGRVARSHGCESVLLGLSNLDDLVALRALEGLLNEVDSDVAVLQAPPGWDPSKVRKIVVAMGGRGGQEVLRSRLLTRFGEQTKAATTYIHVVPTSASDAAVKKARRALLSVAGDECPGEVTTLVVKSDDVLEEVAKRADEADLLIMGLERLGGQKRFGELTVKITQRTSCATLLLKRRI